VEQESFVFSDNDKPFIKGTHLVTIFHNEQNLYSVVRIRVKETNLNYDEKEAVITGYFPPIHEEEIYTFYGKMKEHPRFGIQFHVDTFQREVPESKEGVIAYLSGSLFKGIGKKIAESIVEKLGEKAISKILANPSLLDQIPKLSGEKAKQLYDTLAANQGLEQIMINLSSLGFGPQLSMKIYQAYKEDTISIIEQNPYQLVETIEGIGFTRADEIGLQLGIGGSHPSRIKAAILYTLDRSCVQDGHSYTEAEELLISVKTLLEQNQNVTITFEQITESLIQLGEEGKIIGEEKRFYMPSLYFSEKGIVTNIKRIMSQDSYADQFPESEFLLELGKLEERIGMEYAEEQKDAIFKALHSPMLILTGGPGTGKTTVIKGIVELYSELHGLSLNPKDYNNENPFPFVLAAPTGRAAKRMKESTGLPAVTIHRLLGWNGSDVQRDEDNPISGRLLIVDEMSMVDIWLANQLFKALPNDMQVILVGDEDQLPSVGPGQVLKDLLASSVIPVTRLESIFRQEDGSSIIQLAHAIKNGQLPPDIRKPQGDRSFFSCSTNQVADVIRQVVTNARQKGFPARDIQVLAPMYRGSAGIDSLNVLLQGILNDNRDKKKRELTFGDVVYRVGDKVLQLVNQPENGIYNGDMGEIIAIIYAKENEDKQDQIFVSFDGIEAKYTRQELNQITHAYCCSIHKSQGSEFPIVILPVVKSYHRMLRRNLIYTAITRSKQFLIVCGEEEALRYGVGRSGEEERRTTLLEKLQEGFRDKELISKPENPVTENESSNEDGLTYEQKIFQTDPMIGMENITPYDFMIRG
jgi:exodeoxyribonuclease V alpha subunit